MSIARAGGRPASDASKDQGVPGDALLHPLTLLALAILLLNDHLGKTVWPGFVTGKLSDFAGLIFFPLVLVSCWEISRAATGHKLTVTSRPIKLATAATFAVFVLVKTTVLGSVAWSWALGAGLWVSRAAYSTIAGSHVPPLVPVIVVRDPTDLIALPALGIALAIGLSRVRPSPLGSDTVVRLGA